MAKRIKLIVGILLIGGLYTLYDLWAPLTHNICHFDATAVGKLDAQMWRAYYEKKPVKLFFQLSYLLRQQYGMPYFRSYLASYYAAQAAFVFKQGKARPDYEKALPYLNTFFSMINEISNEPFDAENEARLELEWWIAHRERQPTEVLGMALAQAAAAIYHIPPDALQQYGDLRTQAMRLRDARGASITEAEWETIENLLVKSWQALAAVVQQPKPS